MSDYEVNLNQIWSENDSFTKITANIKLLKLREVERQVDTLGFHFQ